MATNQVYGTVLNKQIDWTTDTIKVALVTSAYTPNIDTNSTWADVSANEASGTNYTAGGITLTSKTTTYDPATNTQMYDAADVQWQAITLTARYAVVYDVTKSNALVCVYDFTTNQSPNNQDFILHFDDGTVNGIFKKVV